MMPTFVRVDVSMVAWPPRFTTRIGAAPAMTRGFESVMRLRFRKPAFYTVNADPLPGNCHAGLESSPMMLTCMVDWIISPTADTTVSCFSWSV